MVRIQDLKKISEYEWEIPVTYREDMRVPVRIFANRALLDAVSKDKSLEQAVNAATLPGLVGHVVVMPDMHQGYGFPIGGVAATKYPEGVISPGAIGYDINCLAGDTPVLHPHGYTRTIAEMQAAWRGAEVACFDLETGAAASGRVGYWFREAPKHPVLEVKTAAGQTISGTADHPFWTERGMVPLGELAPGDRVAVFPFEGVPYEEPDDRVIVSQEDLIAFLDSIGKGDSGNARAQILNHLKRLNLLPLKASSPALPLLCKILGFVFGDGSISFPGVKVKGVTGFYGKAEDLEDIRRDLRSLGLNPSRIWARTRRHAIRTTYDEYTFDRKERWFTVNSTGFAALLACLGAPVGRKAAQVYDLPSWLWDQPLWHRRLFLAAFFGAELTAPAPSKKNPKNFPTPLLSMNKRPEAAFEGKRLFDSIRRMLLDFSVQSRMIAPREERINAAGDRSIRLRLMILGEERNLEALWSRVGFEYNRERRARAAWGVGYLRTKAEHVLRRVEAAETAAVMHAIGAEIPAIHAQLEGAPVNARFIQRSIYERRRTPPRAALAFPGFSDYVESASDGLGRGGMVWAEIVEITPDPGIEWVYDISVNHPDHNFVGSGFVVSNCGVRLLGSQIDFDDAERHLDRLANTLDQYCPSGVGGKGTVPLTESEMKDLCRDGARWALRRGFATEQDLRRTEEGGRLDGADPGKVSPRALGRGRPQLGTLGAGNHFIEVDVVDEIFDDRAADAMGLRRGALAVQIHCGSRGFGHQICTDYVRDFQQAVHRYGIRLPDRELVCAPMDSPEGQDYLAAMRCAANYAFANRQVLAHHARRAFEDALAGAIVHRSLHQVYDIAHNMGKIEDHVVDGARMKVCVHRKGATRAFGPGFEGLPGEYRKIGQPVLVPGSMGTASWVLTGTETSMLRSFGSTCHGAGRMMSRSRAKKEVWGATLREELEARGIRIRAGSLAGLAEEAPVAYKDVDEVVETVAGAGIARKVARLVPVAVIKG